MNKNNNPSSSAPTNTIAGGTHMYYDTLQLTETQREQVVDDLVNAGLLVKANKMTKTTMTGPHYGLPEDYGTEDYVS